MSTSGTARTPGTARVQDLRRSNRSRALWHLYLDGPSRRQAIGEATGVSLATVSNVVTELLDVGVLREERQPASTGRPAGLVGIDPGYGHVVGVDIGEASVLVELFDLGMQVRASHRSRTQLTRLDPDDAAEHVVEGVERVIAEAGVDPGTVLGVGVGVPGLVEHVDGAVVDGQTVGWRAVPFEALLRKRSGLPFAIDNGAKLMGQAEQWFGAARGADHAVILLLGTGVGTSIIIDNELYRGATSSAGEWGHSPVVVDGRPCRCGALGCLEAYVGAGALLDRYAELGGSGLDPALELEERAEALVASAASDPAAADVLAETVRYLGAGIAGLVNVFNPRRVVVGGRVGRALAAAALPELQAAAGRGALRLPFSHTLIVGAELGTDAVALGAATLPMARFLSSGAT
ncbi:ROK family protein [Angustibacter aerolatus]